MCVHAHLMGVPGWVPCVLVGWCDVGTREIEIFVCKIVQGVMMMQLID